MELTQDNRTALNLRLAGVLTAGGMLAEVVATAFHPARAYPNDHPSAFADAELVRALEWGANAFFRLLQGATVGLFGLTLARTSVAPRWLGWVGVAAGLLTFGKAIRRSSLARPIVASRPPGAVR